jgi:hypothetical protein
MRRLRECIMDSASRAWRFLDHEMSLAGNGQRLH